MDNTREKLIELLSYFGDCYVMDYRHIVCGTRICDSADYLINNVVTLDNQVASSKCISVKDRLPTKEDAKIMGEYLPAIQKGQKPNVWKWTEVAKHPQYFTHWYALPQPPKGE